MLRTRNSTTVTCRTTMLSLGKANMPNQTVLATLVAPFVVGNRQLAFTAAVTPTLTGISPSTGGLGTVITLIGSFPPGSATGLRIWLGANECNVLDQNLSFVQCAVTGNRAGHYDVTVETLHGLAPQVPHIRFTYRATIFSLSPVSGSRFGGSLVTVHGDGFSTVHEHNRVTLGDVQCNVVASTHTQLLCLTSTDQHTIRTDIIKGDASIVLPYLLYPRDGAPGQSTYLGCFRDHGAALARDLQVPWLHEAEDLKQSEGAHMAVMVYCGTSLPKGLIYRHDAKHVLRSVFNQILCSAVTKPSRAPFCPTDCCCCRVGKAHSAFVATHMDIMGQHQTMSVISIA